MARNLEQILSEMPVGRIDAIVARARTLVAIQSKTEVKCSACAPILVSDATTTQHPCEVEETDTLLATGNLCPSCGGVGNCHLSQRF